MAAFAPVTDADLARARKDAAFRQKLLEQNLETLLARVKKLRNSAPPAQSVGARQMREAIELAVRLAEMIQGAPKANASRSNGAV
ncbi:MAG TPA: hypothetical protein VFA80_17980 [Xanthobacteraceae bacterium]|nr:hypothetical protein [Xanthobacteraceae bacterium]